MRIALFGSTGTIGQRILAEARPGHGDPRLLVDAAESLVKALSRPGAPRLIVVGGAGSLQVAPGKQLVDTPEFSAAWKLEFVILSEAKDLTERSFAVEACPERSRGAARDDGRARFRGQRFTASY